MKKIIYSLVFVSLFLPSVAFAGSCPILEGKIDNAISELDKDKHEFIIHIANMLKEEGVKAHQSGDHAMAEELLNGAIRLLNI